MAMDRLWMMVGVYKYQCSFASRADLEGSGVYSPRGSRSDSACCHPDTSSTGVSIMWFMNVASWSIWFSCPSSMIARINRVELTPTPVVRTSKVDFNPLSPYESGVRIRIWSDRSILIIQCTTFLISHSIL